MILCWRFSFWVCISSRLISFCLIIPVSFCFSYSNSLPTIASVSWSLAIACSSFSMWTITPFKISNACLLVSSSSSITSSSSCFLCKKEVKLLMLCWTSSSFYYNSCILACNLASSLILVSNWVLLIFSSSMRSFNFPI